MTFTRRIDKNIAFALLTFVFLTYSHAAKSSDENPLISGAATLTKAKSVGRLSVIVKLKVDNSQSENISRSQDTLIEKMDRHSPSQTKCFEHLPMMSMELGADGVAALLDDPNVEAVFEDQLINPSLFESTNLIGASSAQSTGATGSNQVVAILDSGVDRNHPFLSNKVVNEACFSTNLSLSNASSVCPNGSTSQIGVGSAAPCSANGCNHGTHVAGIAAGKGSSFSGVASEANIIAVQVFSEFSGSICGGSSPCIRAYTSDIISGLEHVYSQRNNYNIAAVNLSLGGGSYSESCDYQPIKGIIDLLKTANIATVVAAGNAGLTNAVGFPACVSSAIVVGASTKSDTVASYSNSSGLVDILAPGSGIQSSIPGTGYAYLSGTSMAAPHIAGAFAALRTEKASASVGSLLNSMQNTGVSITDGKNNIIKPRVQLDLAMHFNPPTILGTPGDFNADAKTDILWRHKSVGVNWLYQMNGTQVGSSDQVNQVADLNWRIEVIGDLDADGDADILWRHAQAGVNAIYSMNGERISDIKILNQVPDLNWQIAGSGDFDQDGATDILWRNKNTGMVWLYLMENTSIKSSLPVANVSNIAWQIAGVADFNNDQKADILWRHIHTGQTWLYQMDGAVISQSKPINTVADLNWQIVGLGDLNNDGSADIIWRHKINGFVWSYLMDGSTIKKSAAIAAVSPTWKIQQISDFNADGKADIFWRHSQYGVNWIYLMDENNITQSQGLDVVGLDWEVVRQR